MKDSQNITLAEIQQKIDVIEIQLKMLFESYQNFVKDFLMWRVDDPKRQDHKAKHELIHRMDLIMGALDECSDDIQHYVSLADDITDKVHKTKSVSMIKSMEHKLMNIDKTLSRCNALIFIIDESQFAIEEILQVTKENKHRILN